MGYVDLEITVRSTITTSGVISVDWDNYEKWKSKNGDSVIDYLNEKYEGQLEYVRRAGVTNQTAKWGDNEVIWVKA